MSIHDEFKKLRELVEAGILTQAEYDAERRALAEEALGHSLASGGSQSPHAPAGPPVTAPQEAPTYKPRRYEKGKTTFSVHTSKFGAGIADMTGLPGGACSVGARVLHDFTVDRVRSVGRFYLRRVGTFSRHKRSARTGRNPQTGEKIRLPAQVVLKFKASPILTSWLATDAGDWPHALSDQEPKRLGHWGPSARGYLGDHPASKHAKGLSIRRHMAWAVCIKSEMPLSWAVKVVRAWELVLVHGLRDDGRVQSHGLGMFKVHARAAQKGRNPQTGERITIPARLHVGFRRSAALSI